MPSTSSGPVANVAVAARYGGLMLADTVLAVDAPLAPMGCALTFWGPRIPARGRRVILAAATVPLFGTQLVGRAVLQAPYRQPFALGKLELTFFPAGYLAGASQLLVESASGRFLFLGRLCGGEDNTDVPVVPCDTVILSPGWHTYSAEAWTPASIGTEVGSLLRTHPQAVLVAEPWAAVDILMALETSPYRTAVTSSVARMAARFVRAGLRLKRPKVWRARTPAAGVLVASLDDAALAASLEGGVPVIRLRSCVWRAPGAAHVWARARTVAWADSCTATVLSRRLAQAGAKTVFCPDGPAVLDGTAIAPENVAGAGQLAQLALPLAG